MSKTYTASLLGRKLGMTSLFAEDGRKVSCTVIEAGPCTVVAKRTKDDNGYDAVQVGFGEVKSFRVNKPMLGHFKKAGQTPARHLAELRLPAGDAAKFEVGQQIKADVFQAGELVDVTGTSKGKGFQGVMKRHNYAGFKMTHGTHEYRRHPGGISAREKPGKVWKGKRLPGHMGSDRVTASNLRVFQVRPEENLLLVEGAVPGAVGAILKIRKARKAALRQAHKARKASK
ncbi:MAG: 50S ribosomal protein L3 [Bdellovibrionota bacterium]